MPAKKQEILNQSIKDLPFSEAFKLFSKKMGVNTLTEMTAIPVKKLMHTEGFTYHSLHELVQFLEERGLTNLLKE